MLLAAGRGERLRPLTDHTPKPLLPVGRWRLMEWHLRALSDAGVREVVINTAWLGEQFEPLLGNGQAYGLRIHWSHEAIAFGGALETAGGIRQALPWLDDTFWVVSADVFVPGFDFDDAQRSRFAASGNLAQLWLVPNAPHHPVGDFATDAHDQIVPSAAAGAAPRRTWCSVGLFRRAMFAPLPAGQRLPLRPLLDEAAARSALCAKSWTGPWIDVGTPERLQAARTLAQTLAATPKPADGAA
jgi:MurNAc alpha-1-phosphate uridylyltransferase